jgi:predicted DNA-binding transcriptional regulator AlpA
MQHEGIGISAKLRHPTAHEIAPRRIAWFKDEVAAWQLGINKVA